MKPEVREPLRQSLMQHEGLVLKAYDDSTGRVVHPGTTVGGWVTVGYGRNLVGRGITTAEAEFLLSNDISVVERALHELLPEWSTWSAPRQWAIAEITYNLGVERFLRLFPHTAADLRASRFGEAADRLLVAKWRKDVGDGRALPIIRALKTGAWT